MLFLFRKIEGKDVFLEAKWGLGFDLYEPHEKIPPSSVRTKTHVLRNNSLHTS